MRGRASRTLLTLAAGVTLTALSLATAGPARAAHARHTAFSPPGGAPAASLLATLPVGRLPAGMLPAGILPQMLPGVSGGPPVMTAHQAGYVATGQLFRYAQAVITVPVQPCRPGAGQPRLYVALAGRPGSARAGLECDAAGRWRGFVSLSRPGLAAPLARAFAAGRLHAADAVFASVYRSGPGSVRFFLTVPGGSAYRYTAATGSAAGYDQAQALADWTQASPTIPPSVASTREARFLSGGFTTASGEPGTFEGPWALSRWEATGAGPGRPGRLLAAPGYPGADGSQRLLGTWGDAFGVWLYAWPPG
jgi:hypothetical protein